MQGAGFLGKKSCRVFVLAVPFMSSGLNSEIGMILMGQIYFLLIVFVRCSWGLSEFAFDDDVKNGCGPEKGVVLFCHIEGEV
jgi:hypothetical protein